MPVPLPNRWTNHDESKSKQPLYLTAMQVTYAELPATVEKGNQITNSKDKSWATMNLLGTSIFTMRDEFQTLSKIKTL